MSQMMNLLARAGNSGIYQTSNVDNTKFFKLIPDLWAVDIDSQKSVYVYTFFRLLADELKFPSYFGGGWNALVDCLEDMSWMSEKHLLITISGFEDFAHSQPSDFRELLEVFDSVTSFWREKMLDRRIYIVFVSSIVHLPNVPEIVQ